MKVTLVQHTPTPLYTVAEAAAVCYDSEPSLKIVKGCIRSGHTSVLEHASFTFRIEGISRSCSHQIVRHRMYIQLNFGFAVPIVFFYMVADAETFARTHFFVMFAQLKTYRRVEV